MAIKVLQEKYAAGSRTAARFVEEARITGQLQHPGIPAVYHVGTWVDGRPFLSMKLIKGQTLDALLAAGTPLNALGVFEQIAQTVGYAHSRGVIHRDLKPANVMVGAFGEVQVMDWGLAKVLNQVRHGEYPSADTTAELVPDGSLTVIRVGGDSDRQHTQAGSAMGTPTYMPPEQARGDIDRIDQRSDVFGLGAILYAMLTGRPLYEGGSTEEVYAKAVQGKTNHAIWQLVAAVRPLIVDADLIFVRDGQIDFVPPPDRDGWPGREALGQHPR